MLHGHFKNHSSYNKRMQYVFITKKYNSWDSQAATCLQIADAWLLYFKLNLLVRMVRGNMFLKDFDVVRPTVTVDAVEDTDQLGLWWLMMCQVTAMSSQRASSGSAMFARELGLQCSIPRTSRLIMTFVHMNLHRQQHHNYSTTSRLQRRFKHACRLHLFKFISVWSAVYLM